MTAELHGQGDPLLVAAMKDLAIRERERADLQRPTECHHGGGDPLFTAAMDHPRTLRRTSSLPLPPTLRSELSGHGDPLMKEAVVSWGVAPGIPSGAVEKHGERKKQGDPLLLECLKGATAPGELKRTSSLPPKLEEVSGHGDSLMTVLLSSWKLGAGVGGATNDLHPATEGGEFKKHGDPLLREFVAAT